MLLKYTQAQKRIKATGIGKPQRTAGGMVKLTSGLMTVMPKIHHRKVIKVANKRPATIHRTPTAVKREQTPVDPCENSNDSGLGFDHHIDYHTVPPTHTASTLRFSDKEVPWQSDEPPEVKRRRLEIKLESDDANDNFTFPETVRQPAQRTICVPVRGRSRMVVPVAPLTLSSQLSATSHNGLTQLLIVCQPEQQHRARYQTEGSRGAVKDRTGNGFPVVKLVGYDRPTTLQVFIGTDQGRVAPHMFYQACRVSGKNSTPCVEKKIDGTIVIEVDVEPSKDMVVTCDCVGILKERNVDVEHRFPEESSGRSKKKSTRCRMVFRTTITNPDGFQETLQVTSQPIVCTQPPGVPEICKKSLTSCSVRGGQELFILGKNFLKDTRVVFQEGEAGSPTWSQSVQPDKEFLQQSHLVCVVPPYRTPDISEPVSVRVLVESSSKASEPHTFVYLPDNSVLAPDGNMVSSSVVTQGGRAAVFPTHVSVTAPLAAPFIAAQASPGSDEKVHPVMMWDKPAEIMMPPPPPAMLPITVRRSSIQMIVPDTLAPEELKREIPDPLMDPPKPLANISDLSSTQSPSMDTLRRFVTNNSLPSINVGTYLSNIESNSIYANKVTKGQIMSEVPQIMIPKQTPMNKPIFSGESTNLLTTVEPVIGNQSATMPFDGRNKPATMSGLQSSPENLSVIVNPSMIQKQSSDSQMTQDIRQHEQMSGSQSVGMDMYLPSAMNKQVGSSPTERLDAFVNSAAESHISPNSSTSLSISTASSENSSTSPVSEMVVNRMPDRNNLAESTLPTMIQPSALPVSPHDSPPGVTERGICPLLNSSVQASAPNSPNEAQTVSNIQATIEHLNNQNMTVGQPRINSLIHSPPHVSTNQTQTFSEVQASLGQLTSQTVISSQITNSDINDFIQSSAQASVNRAEALSKLQATLEEQLSPQNISNNQISQAGVNNLIHSSPQSSTSQEQVLSNLQATLEQQLSSHSVSSSSMNHSSLNSLVQPSPQIPSNQSLSNLQASLEQQLSSHSLSSSQLNPSDLSNLIQSSTQNSENSVQSLSNLQVSLEQQISVHTMTSPQLNASLNNIMQPSSQQTSQSLSNLQASLEEQLSSHPMNSSQLNTTELRTLIQASTQDSRNEAQALSNLQASLEHMSSQKINSTEMIHPESVQSSNLNMTRMENTVQAPQQSTTNGVQALTSLQASLEHHLSSQVIGSVQAGMESMNNRNIPINNLSNSVPTSPSIQVVNPSQSLSNLQASLEHHLSSQVMASAQPILESMASSAHSPENLNASIDPSQGSVSQSQALSNIQLSLGQFTSQVLNSTQARPESSLTMSLNDSMQTSQVQAVVSQAQVLSNLHASIEQHLTSQVLSTNQTSPETMMPPERLNNSVHTSPQQSPNHALSRLDASVEHISSQVLGSTQQNITDTLSTNNISITDSQTLGLTNSMSLMSAQAMNTSTSTPGMLTSPSHHSPTSALMSPGISMTSSPTISLPLGVSLSPSKLSIHKSQSMEISPSNIVLNTQQSLMPTDLSMNNNSSVSLTQMQNTQGGSLQSSSVGPFGQMTSDMQQSLPVEGASMNQYERCQEIQSANKESERKETAAYMMPQHTVPVSGQCQTQVQTVKSREESMSQLNELTQMSEHDLIRYINPSCFDTV